MSEPSPASALVLAALPGTRPLDGLRLERPHRVARRILGCDHLANDVLQEALIALWRQSDAPEHPEAWLTRAAELRALQFRRALERRQHHESEAMRCHEHPECANPLHTACAHELQGRVDVAIAGLPLPQREVLEKQLEVTGDYRSTARALAVPVGTVRSRLARARAALRDAIG